MAKNLIQRGDVLTVPAPANVRSGEVVIIGELHGVALGNAAEAAPPDLQTAGLFELPTVAADAFDICCSSFLAARDNLATATGPDHTPTGLSSSWRRVGHKSGRE